MKATFPLDVSKTVRIDTGPRVRRAKATKDLLASGKVRSHYQIGAKDALGEEIVEDKFFSYVDWSAPESENIFTVYKLDEGGQDADGNDIGPRYQIIQRHDTAEEAIKHAKSLGG